MKPPGFGTELARCNIFEYGMFDDRELCDGGAFGIRLSNRNKVLTVRCPELCELIFLRHWLVYWEGRGLGPGGAVQIEGRVGESTTEP